MGYNSSVAWLKSQLVATEALLAVTKDSIIMKASLENRIQDLKEQIEKAESIPEEAKLDVWFSGKSVYGSLGISSAFMQETMQAIVGMIKSSTREMVRKLKSEQKKAEMPKGQFYITALTQGSFGYELSYKSDQETLFDDPAIIDSIRNMMDVIETATEENLDIDRLIQAQPIRLLSNLKDLFSSLKKHNSFMKMESGANALSLDVHSVNIGYDNICLSDISEKTEIITAVFQGAFIETGRFEYTDEEGKVRHGSISEELSYDEIAELNRLYSRKECQLSIIHRIVNYTNGNKKEGVELVGIEYEHE